MESTKPTKSRHDYAVAWVAALPIERASATAMLDGEHGRPHNFRQPSTDPNSYTWGTIGEHNVVIVSLASGVYGNVMAAVTVSELLGSFPNIKFGLLVGIGAGVPRSDYDVRLGDIVVGYPVGTSSGVIQYDLGKAKAGGAWERKDSFNRPPELLLKAVSALQASRDLSPSRNTELVQEATSRHSHWGKAYVDADTLPDRLFKIAYHHPIDAKDCLGCSVEAEVKRNERSSEEPNVHYGVIASGNSLVKDAETREKIASLDPNCICLEMEAAGLVNSLPCLVIRGICDYADTHKNDSWQRLASARAAAYAKELLGHTAPVHHDERGMTPMRSKLVSSARRHGRVKQVRGQGKTNEDMVRLLPLLHKCPYAERKNRNIKRVAGTCQWFTNHNRFKDWYTQRSSSLLWISADPGCGKSVLARYLVDELFPAPDRMVCYFFFKDDSSEQRSASIAMCALLHQLLERDRELLKHPAVKRLLTSRDNFDDAFWDLWSTLMAILADQKATGEVIFVLDALDECSDADRKSLIEAISEVDFEGPIRARFKLLLTSRPYDHIQRSFQVLQSKMPVIHLSGEGPEEVAQISKEIGLVIAHTVQQISFEKQLTPEEHVFLLGHLTSVENRTYLWVHLTIDIIRKSPGFNKGDVRRAITELPSSVDEAYERILNRCSDVEKAKKIFASILVAVEALTVEDISVILAIGDNEGKVTSDIEASIEPADRMATTIRDLCGLFVVIKDSEVHLLHQTAREFLMSKDPTTEQSQHAKTSMTKTADFRTATWKHSLNLAECHRFLTSVCVRFLQMDQQRKSVYEFEKYAVWHWDEHMNNALLDKSERLITVGVELCNDKMRSTWLDDFKKGFESGSTDPSTAVKKPEKKSAKAAVDNERLVDPRFSPLLILAAWVGIEPLVLAVLDQYPNVNISDDEGTTALWWAAHQGHDSIAKILLARGAKIDGNTLYPDLKPLHKASASGSSNTVQLLLDHGAKVNARDARGVQSLHYAAGYGHRDTVKLLIDAGAEVNGRDYFGSTPLHSSAAWGHLDVMKLLIDYGAKVDSVTKLGVTPLNDAANEQDIPAVDVLLDAGADIDFRAKNGSTPLTVAAQRNCIPLVEHLINRGAKVDHGGAHGTALCQAVVEGHVKLVELLLDRGANVNWVNDMGIPVSFWLSSLDTSSRKRQIIVRALVDRGMKVDTIGRHGRTVILQCCLKGRTKSAKLLLRSQLDINDVVGFAYRGWGDRPSSRFGPAIFGSYCGWTTLHAAAFMADTSLTRYLLEHGAAIEVVDKWKHTPLFWAVMGCVDNIMFSAEDSETYWQWPFFFTSLGFKGPPKMIMPRTAAAWEWARFIALRDLYPVGYETAQLTTVKLLLEHGANPRIKGINWRYSLLPGLRKFRNRRKALFALLKEYQDKSPDELSAINLARALERDRMKRKGENDAGHTYDIFSLDSDSSSRASSESLFLGHRPHALDDIVEEDSEYEEVEENNKLEAEGIDTRQGIRDEENVAESKMLTTMEAANRYISESMATSKKEKNSNDDDSRDKT